MTITAAHTALPDLQSAVYTALTNSTNFTSLVTGLFDPARENQAFPYATFGEHIESRWYHFGNTGRQVLFLFHIWSQLTTGFSEAYSILDAITNTLETSTLTLNNFTMTQSGFLFESATKLNDPDGITKHVVARYRTWLVAK